MRVTHLPPLVLLLGVMLTAGCASAPQAATEPLEIHPLEYRRLYLATKEILSNEGYVLDRQDYRFGQVTTMPEAAPTVFEFWKPAHSTTQQALASTIHQQRRRVRVMLEPMGEVALNEAGHPVTPSRYLMRVEVLIERKQSPAAQMTGSFSGRRVVNQLAQTPQELQDRGINGQYWTVVGRDPLTEHQLLAAIVRRSIYIREKTPTQNLPAGVEEAS